MNGSHSGQEGQDWNSLGWLLWATARGHLGAPENTGGQSLLTTAQRSWEGPSFPRQTCTVMILCDVNQVPGGSLRFVFLLWQMGLAGFPLPVNSPASNCFS